MQQFVVRVEAELAAAVDELVAEGVYESRSDAVRQTLEAEVDRQRRRRIGEQIVAGYERMPLTEDELAGIDDEMRAMVMEEPW